MFTTQNASSDDATVIVLTDADLIFDEVSSVRAVPPPFTTFLGIFVASASRRYRPSESLRHTAMSDSPTVRHEVRR